MSRSDAASSVAVRGLVFTGFGVWLVATIIDVDALRDLAVVFLATGAVAYFVLARRQAP